jgi:hypothetical protein
MTTRLAHSGSWFRISMFQYLSTRLTLGSARSASMNIDLLQASDVLQICAWLSRD